VHLISNLYIFNQCPFKVVRIFSTSIAFRRTWRVHGMMLSVLGEFVKWNSVYLTNTYKIIYLTQQVGTIHSYFSCKNHCWVQQMKLSLLGESTQQVCLASFGVLTVSWPSPKLFEILNYQTRWVWMSDTTVSRYCPFKYSTFPIGYTNAQFYKKITFL